MFRCFAYVSSRRCISGALSAVLFHGVAASGQTLNLPARPNNALTGARFTNLVAYAARDDRENWTYAQVMSGNVPGWLRVLKPINTSIAGHTGIYYVTPDYLAVGSDQDYFLTPCTPILGQRLAMRLGCSLPTRRLVNQIWTNAGVKLNPQPITASPEMITVPVFAWHNYLVRTQRNTFTNSQPFGALVGGHKKDVIISIEITNRPPPPRVVIYGWHYQSGAEIQPLSAVHEATYADYSHGIRLVQSSMTVDGAANNVSNVLKSATLTGLLSDEGVVPLPYYSVAAFAPVVLIQPASQSVLAGQSVVFEVLAVGDPPLTYRWRKNGVLFQTTTNASLTLTNLQPQDAGSWSVSVSNLTGVVTSRVAMVRARTNSFPLLFRDDFETNSVSQWDSFWAASDTTPDYTADWAYDYSSTPYYFNGLVAPIPPAPNSPPGQTRALRLTVNNNDATGATAAVNLYPKLAMFSGNFAIKFDMWINYPGIAGGINSTGSTQHALFGLNHLGTNANWAPASATASDGLWFAVDGEGGTSADYRVYQGNLLGTQIDQTSSLPASNNVATIYQNLFPAGVFETAGAPGKRWVEVELRQTNNMVLWVMDGTVISLRTNATAFTGGKLMLGFMDMFASIANPARDAFVLYDNLRVENLSPPPIRFEHVERQVNGMISLTLTSAPNDMFWLESSTNLGLWQTLTILATTNGSATLVDSNAITSPIKFYRARR